MRYKKVYQNTKSPSPDIGTIESILRAARELFYTKGYVKTTTREIATLANVNLGLIPYYFKSKENLATQIYNETFDALYHQIESINLKNISSAEYLYISNILVYDLMEAQEGYSMFYHELLDHSSIADYPSKPFIECSRRLIKEYELCVSEEENNLYLLSLKGSEKLLSSKKYHKQIDVDYYTICDILISNYFYNLGLSDETIASILSKSNVFLKNLSKNKKSTL